MLKAFQIYFKPLLWVAVLCGPFWTAQAQSQAAVGSSIYRPKSSKSEDFNFKLDLGLKQISYASKSNADNGSLQQIDAELMIGKQGSFFTNTDLIVGTFTIENSMYVALPEAYAGYGRKETSATFGRKIENYSFSDNYFNLGLLQPTFTNDFINYRANGLAGLGVHHHQGNFGFNVAYNPLFLPNQGPQVKIEDGVANTSNRWAPLPPERIRLGDENREIIYAIKDYKITDVVNNPGYIASVFFGENKARPLFMATYAHQPINEIALSREAFADIATFRGNVILEPHVLYHEVYAADLNLDSSTTKFSLSFFSLNIFWFIT